MESIRFYSVVNLDKQPIILAELNAMPDPKPFFDFKAKDKFVEFSQIPLSNVELDKFVPINRTVLAFETIFTNQKLFDLAKENSEWWWVADELTAQRLQWFLSQTDSVTVGKTKEQLDILFESQNIA
jgi:hypothetical protein